MGVSCWDVSLCVEWVKRSSETEEVKLVERNLDGLLE